LVINLLCLGLHHNALFFSWTKLSVHQANAFEPEIPSLKVGTVLNATDGFVKWDSNLGSIIVSYCLPLSILVHSGVKANASSLTTCSLNLTVGLSTS